MNDLDRRRCDATRAISHSLRCRIRREVKHQYLLLQLTTGSIPRLKYPVSSQVPTRLLAPQPMSARLTAVQVSRASVQGTLVAGLGTALGLPGPPKPPKLPCLFSVQISPSPSPSPDRNPRRQHFASTPSPNLRHSALQSIQTRRASSCDDSGGLFRPICDFC